MTIIMFTGVHLDTNILFKYSFEKILVVSDKWKDVHVILYKWLFVYEKSWILLNGMHKIY